MKDGRTYQGNGTPSSKLERLIQRHRIKVADIHKRNDRLVRRGTRISNGVVFLVGIRPVAFLVLREWRVVDCVLAGVVLRVHERVVEGAGGSKVVVVWPLEQRECQMRGRTELCP